MFLFVCLSWRSACAVGPLHATVPNKKSTCKAGSCRPWQYNMLAYLTNPVGLEHTRSIANMGLKNLIWYSYYVTYPAFMILNTFFFLPFSLIYNGIIVTWIPYVFVHITRILCGWHIVVVRRSETPLSFLSRGTSTSYTHQEQLKRFIYFTC